MKEANAAVGCLHGGVSGDCQVESSDVIVREAPGGCYLVEPVTGDGARWIQLMLARGGGMRLSAAPPMKATGSS